MGCDKNTKIIAAVIVVIVVVVAAVGIGLAMSNSSDDKKEPVPPVTQHACLFFNDKIITGSDAPLLYIKDVNGKEVCINDELMCELPDSEHTQIYVKDSGGWEWNNAKGTFEKDNCSIKVTISNGTLTPMKQGFAAYEFSYDSGLRYNMTVEIIKTR